MMSKRRSMLGKRHLMAQQQQGLSRPAQGHTEDDKSGTNSSWRGRGTGNVKTSSRRDKDYKKCLFRNSPSPGVSSYTYRMQRQERNDHLSNDNLANVTGILSLGSTPSSTSRTEMTPSLLHQRRVDMERTRYGPLPTNERLLTKTLDETDKCSSSSSSSFPTQKFLSFDLDHLKPPDLPSCLEQIFLEEKLNENSSSLNFCFLEPPKSPGPSHLDRIIMEEKLEQPLDPELKKIQNLNLEDPSTRLHFSPPLSSTCIGSPDSGKKNSTVKEHVNENLVGTGRKLSTIQEDSDVSVIEFELNERTVCDFDNTLLNTTVNNTVKPMKATCLENIPEESRSKATGEVEPSWDYVMSWLESMEQAEISRTTKHMNELEILHQNLKKLHQKIETESVENISNIRKMKKMLETFKHKASAQTSTENKENDFTFKAPTCKKEQMDKESIWLNSVRKENPELLKTPNPSRKISQSTMLTPHSLSNVLHNQMNELYK